MAEYRAYIMDKDGLISRAIGLVCPDDETAMEYAKQFVEGHPSAASWWPSNFAGAIVLASSRRRMTTLR